RQGCVPRPGPRHEPGTSVPRSTHYDPLRRLSHAVLVQELGHVGVAHRLPLFPTWSNRSRAGFLCQEDGPRPKPGPVSNHVPLTSSSRMQGSQLNLEPCNLGFKVSVLFEDVKHPETVKFFQNINLALGIEESEVEPPTVVQLPGTDVEGALPSLRGEVAKLPVPTTVLAED